MGDREVALERSGRPAPDLSLGDASSASGAVKLSQLWSEGPVVLYFLRHFG